MTTSNDGSTSRSAEAAQKRRRPGPIRAKTFFEHVCPSLFGIRGPLCQDLGGRYAFHLEGRGGGTWTVDFSELVVHPKAEPADLRIWMNALDFETMLGGRLDVSEAIRDGVIKFEGPQTLFHNLAVFAAPPTPRERTLR